MKLDTKKFALGTLLVISGVTMLFVAMYIQPQGEIHSSVLGAAGEVFLLAGSLLGLDSYFDFKIKKYINKDKDGDNL